MRASRESMTLFDHATRHVPYQAKGMFPSEVFLFLACCREQRVDLVIESGVRNGMSTKLLAEAFWGPIVSIDREPVIEVPWCVEFIQGDACELVPRLLPTFPTNRIGLLLDGPKGATARALKDVALTQPNVRVVGIHDEPIDAGETFHSHDCEYRATYGGILDLRITHPYAAKYPDGPGLAIWLNPSVRTA